MSGPTHEGRSFTLFRRKAHSFAAASAPSRPCRKPRRWRSSARCAWASTSAARSPTSSRSSRERRDRHAQGPEHAAGAASRRDRRARGALRPLRNAPAVEFLGHSTTIATNALLGQLGLELPRVALVTTHGFCDVIEIGRQNRSEVYNLFVERPRPLVAREDRLTVRERIDYLGNVLAAARGRVGRARLRASCEGATSRPSRSACCTPTSTTRTSGALADAIAAALPERALTRSSEVDPRVSRVRALFDDRRQRGARADRRALSRAARRRAPRAATSTRRST